VNQRAVCAAFAVATLWAAAGSLTARAADFTVPPRPQTEVVDTAGALSDATRTALESELESFESATGNHLVVYIAQTTGNVPLETWTAQTAQTWRVGQTGKDNGAVLFLFMKDHKVRIEVGYGLEGTLTDATANSIIQGTILPKMRGGDTDAAVTGGVDGMIAAIDPSYKTAAPPPAASDASSDDDNAFGMFLFFGFVVLVALWIVYSIVMSIYARVRYGYLIKREGATAAAADMHRSWLHGFVFGGTTSGFGSFFSGGSGDGGGGGFSGGSFGGSFGGGGASGSW